MDTVIAGIWFPLGWKATLVVMAMVWGWCFLPAMVFQVKRLPFPQVKGLAFLNFIVISKVCGTPGSESYEHVLRHELRHIKQQRRFSPWGCALFLGCWYFWHCIIKRRRFIAAWQLNPLELDAENAACK